MNLNPCRFTISFIIALLLSSCSNGSGASSQPNPNNINLHNTAAKFSFESIPEINPFLLDYTVHSAKSKLKDTNVINLCSSDNSVCASVTPPSAAYAMDINQSNSWVIPEFLTSINITFNNDIASDFHISDIYNDLLGNASVAGRITQLDTSKCDSLVATGHTIGQSCSIYMAYSGEQANQLSNQIHILFKWGYGSNSFDLNFPAQNQLISNQNIPILNLANNQNPMVVAMSTGENNSSTDLNYSYSIDNQVLLNNIGTATLSGTPNVPTINLSLGTSFGADVTQLFFANRLVTSCSDGNIPVSNANNCMLPFFVAPTSDTMLNPLTGRFVFQYSNQFQPINYTRRFALSIGDIKPQDFDLGDYSTNKTSTIQLERLNYGNQDSYLQYGIPLKNFKLYVKYDPIFNIGSNLNHANSSLLYGYGDFLNLQSNQTLSGNDIVNQLKLSYDPNCFQGGFDPHYDTGLITNSRECPVYISFNSNISLNKPISLGLYASYDSATQNTHVNQYIGSLNFGASLQPVGNYKNSCQNINWDGSTLSATCKDNQGNLITSKLAYNQTCSINSGVSNLMGNLICDNINDTFPKGDYGQKHCKDITFNNNVLNASCLNDSLGWTQTSLDVTKCNTDSDILDRHGNLVCDYWKPNCNLKKFGYSEYDIPMPTTFQTGDCYQIAAYDNQNKFELDLQGDGTFAIYECSGHDGDCIYSSDRSLVTSVQNKGIWNKNAGNATYAQWQSDGNFVTYNSNNKPVWSSDTDSNDYRRLTFQQDGNLVIYGAGTIKDPDKYPVWSAKQ